MPPVPKPVFAPKAGVAVAGAPNGVGLADAPNMPVEAVGAADPIPKELLDPVAPKAVPVAGAPPKPPPVAPNAGAAPVAAPKAPPPPPHDVDEVPPNGVDPNPEKAGYEI